MLTNDQQHPLYKGDQARGTWLGKRWEHFAGNLTYYETLTKALAEDERRYGLGASDVMLQQLLALGIQFLPPGAIRWAGNDFQATRSVGMEIAGRVTASPDGRVEALDYRLLDSASAWRITYGYEDARLIPVPTSIQIQSFYSNRLDGRVEFQILHWETPLAPERWADYDPSRRFPQARVIIHTNTTFLARQGTNLVFLAASEAPQTRSAVPKGVVVLVIIALLAPFFYFLARTRRKQETTRQNTTRSENV